MATTVDMEQPEKVWGGGNKPFAISYGKIMMWFFIVSDALSFSGFLTAYGFMRYKNMLTWPVAEDVFTHFPFVEGDQPLLYVALMTFILIMSSVTMVLAVHHGHHNNKNKVILWMALTIVGGAIFLGSQAWEWYHFIVGDRGAIEINQPGMVTARTQEGEMKDIRLGNNVIMHVVTTDGEKLSLSQVVHGMENGHASNHGEEFSTDEVVKAFKGNSSLELVMPGKEKLVIPHAAAANLMDVKALAVQGANMTRNEYGKKQFANFFFFITGFHGFHVFSGVVLNFIVFYNVFLGTYERRGHYEMVEKVGLYWHFVDLVWVFVFTFFYLV
ncbi:MAG: cytochrome c oxidase subunit 3 [Schleiferiaceae bacterium]|jgi:cytochrome c oxidase subunit 3|nr:cytochrome c oxidase subunit 3 [Schleiferiaceae bacterium]